MDPLLETIEESWISALNRFDSEIWPLFRDRGYTKGEAHQIWVLSGVASEIEQLNKSLKDSF